MNWSLKQRILRHVRIHGGDSNALARAMHCGVQKDTLMTNEKGLFAQADLRNVRGSTIERKIMSTKTTTKRISLVVAAALTLGGFSAVSVVSANAADLALGTVTAITASSVTTAPTVGTSVFVKAGMSVAALTAASGNSAKTITLSGALTSYPAGGSVGVAANIAANATPAGTATPLAVTAGTVPTAAAAANSVTTTLAIENTTAWSAQAVTYTGGFNFNPTKAGTYVLTVWNDVNQDGIINAAEVQQQVSVTVAASAVFSASTSTAYSTTPTANGAAASATTNAIARSASKTVNSAIEQIKVTLLKSDGTADTSGATVQADVSGVGYVSANTTADTAGTPSTRSATDSSAASVRYVHVNSDGTGGAGYVTVYVTDPNTLVKSVLGVFNYTSYGSVTKLAVSSTNYNIARAGYTTGGHLAARAAATEVGGGTITNPFAAGVSTPAFIVKATDANGNAVSTAAVPTIVSSDATVVTGGTCILDDGSSATYSSSTNGVGYYNCDFSGAQGAKSGSKATLTLKVLDPADTTGLTYITTTLAVSVGGSVAKEVISTDKSSYAPGEALVITVTATDSSGNAVYDGATAVGSVTSSKSLGGSAFAPAIYVGGKASSKSSTGVVSTYAPSLPGSFALNATGTDAATTALTATSTVAGSNDAQIASLITKINALAALIAKIQKKLGVK